MFLLKGATEGRTVMTEERANDLFQKWVRILRLGDWDIRFHWRVHPAELAEKVVEKAKKVIEMQEEKK